MNHLTERELTSVFQDALPAELEQRILLHLAQCESCGRRTEAAIDRYRALRRCAAKEIPPPPHRWKDIWLEMERTDAVVPLLVRAEPPRRPRPIWAGLAAAAVACAVLFLAPRPDAS